MMSRRHLPKPFSAHLYKLKISDCCVWADRCHCKQIPKELQQVDLLPFDGPGAALLLCPNETNDAGIATSTAGDSYACGEWLRNSTFQGMSQVFEVCVCAPDKTAPNKTASHLTRWPGARMDALHKCNVYSLTLLSYNLLSFWY
jgi:hypothetical protein